MKQMNWLILISISALMAVSVIGCQQSQSGEPVLKEDAIVAIDKGAEIAEAAGQTAVSLGFIWPPATVIGGLLVGAAGAWRKMKPKVIEAERNAELATYAGEATAFAIEEFKKANPEEWATLSQILRDNHGLTVENFYRGLRGLPMKD